MGKKYSEETIKKIYELYDGHGTIENISDTLGLCRDTVGVYIRKKYGDTRFKVDKKTIKKINELYAEGVYMNVIAKCLNLDRRTVSAHIKKKGERNVSSRLHQG